LTKSFCLSAVEQNSPGLRMNPYKQVKSQPYRTTRYEFIPRRETMIRVKNLSVLLALALSMTATTAGARAQDKDAKPAEKPAETAADAPPKEESSVTDHIIKLGGQTIPYKATAATILLKNEKDEPTALVYYTAYTRSDAKDLSQRPIAFVYNGGPGSSSVWLHMGSFSPRRVITVNADATPPAPYQLSENPHCLLDKTDLVFLDPVGTGFSHAVGKAQDKDFWGVDQDVKSLAQFVNTYVSRTGRWNSPKFLIGESYGTFRSAALSNYMQSHDGLYFNGIVLISSVLDLGTISFNSGEDKPYIFYLPGYAATAWYHKVLKDRPDNLSPFLEEARQFAQTEYTSALMKGSRLGEAEKSAVAKKLARYTVLNNYVRDELKFGKDMVYHTGSDEAGSNWDWKHRGGDNFGFPGSPNVEGDLIQAMLANPHLQVEVENGIYDLATPFFATEYTMEHLGLPEKLQKNIHLQYYDAGHMMYLRDEDLAKLKANIASFIDGASKQ